eukprot:TRINITY_DN5030_c2_g1_i1.p1 TRINITY_DN5030_c2_g1~~TRINITY_DN5030_c2_g1_i1.p1  ORF type:complete len:258 (+),score=33.75 TRINITY_DN5030_c2_g1_i1:42-776(+)
MHRVSSEIRKTLGFRVHDKSALSRLKSYFTEEGTTKERLNKKFEETRRHSAGPAHQMRTSHAFKMRPGLLQDEENPLEPIYYRSLPKWLRAEGAYAPIEIAKIILYLLIPIWAILLLGSRNLGFVEQLSDWFMDFKGISYRPSYEEQVATWKRIDEQGVMTLFGIEPVPGSTLERKLLEESLKDDETVLNEVPKDSAPSTYFTVMAKLKKKQREDDKVSKSIGLEAAKILEESEHNVAGVMESG